MQTIGINRSGVYDGKIAGLYDLEETLGSGHFAVVKLARHVFTGEKVAVKVIDKTKLDDVSRAHLFQEVRCMKLVQHPNVVRLYEVIDTQTKLYLILELGDGGDLYDYIMKHEGGLSEELAKEYFRQIVRAISYCHQLHVVHRDLKPENVVFFEKLGVVKLTDFGFSNKFCPGQKLETSCGSLAYSAPEILLGDSYDAPAVDVWSLGVILFMLVCGHPPFHEANDSETLTMIMDCKYSTPNHVSSACKELISKMLIRAPEKRATLNQIAQHNWLQNGMADQIGPEHLPLVSKEQVCDEDHTVIIQKMVNGNIATKEEIQEALDRNEYNHISATYFLLAERKLRAHRQEAHAQKRRPDLTLHVSSAGDRLIGRPKIQVFKKDSAAVSSDLTVDSNSHLLAPPPTTKTISSVGGDHLNIPRTAGPEASGRSRKCSIVQEEDDDEEIEIAPCSRRDEHVTPLNRRGSRSEGRINLTFQERMAEKKDATSSVVAVKPTVAASDKVEQRFGVSGCTLVNTENSNPKNRLGAAGGMVNTTKLDADMHKSHRKHSRIMDTSVYTKYLTDSSTITIPTVSSAHAAVIVAPKQYKTMPSPVRVAPQHFDVQQPDNLSDPVDSDTASRRAKFQSTRTTASCSSSDASDDDSENRKKRAHKIVDCAKAPIYRRDSHDDSSDSQDPGNAPSSGGTRATGLVHVTATAPSENAPANNSTNSSQSNGGSGAGESGGRQKCVAQSGCVANSTNGKSSSAANGGGGSGGGGGGGGGGTFRRHRAGRRRASETRLRESQSLNRITEVQESMCEVVSKTQQPVEPQPTESQPPLFDNNQQQQQQQHHQNASHSIGHTTKAKGLSARLLQTFRKSENTNNTAAMTRTSSSLSPLSSPSSSSSNRTVLNNSSTNPMTTTTTTTTLTTTNRTNQDDVDMVIGVELAKVLKVSSDTKTSSSASKKLRMLGKYFQIHKKICIPIPGIFQRGRMYKAQSCSSLVRDKINTTTTTTTMTTASVPPLSAHNVTVRNNNQLHSSALATAKPVYRNSCVHSHLLVAAAAAAAAAAADTGASDANDNTELYHPNHSTATLQTKSMILSVSAGCGNNDNLSEIRRDGSGGDCDGGNRCVDDVSTPNLPTQSFCNGLDASSSLCSSKC